jgi:hypothetical protein
VAGRSGGRTSARAPNPRACRSRGAITAGEGRRFKGQCRDVGARALRPIFSSDDNWLSLSEAERDEWRGYFEPDGRTGCTDLAARPSAILGRGCWRARREFTDPSDEGAQ